MAHISQTHPLILASTSPWRKQALETSGLTFTCISPTADEEELKPSIRHLDVAAQAMALALYKGKGISLQNPDAYILCGDQIGAAEGRIYEKPHTKEKAVEELISLSGKKLTYYTAVALLKNGEVVWQKVATPSVTFRQFTQAEAEVYVELEDVTGICGSCEVVKLGQNLLQSKNGDNSAMWGLPIPQILSEMYRMGLISLKKEA